MGVKFALFSVLVIVALVSRLTDANGLVLKPEVRNTVWNYPTVEPTGNDFLGPVIEELVVGVYVLFGEPLNAVNGLDQFVFSPHIR